MSARRAFDWPGLMRAGLRELGLSPARFWALTPIELLVMLGLEGGSPPLGRARLEELAARYPDAAGKEENGTDGRDRGPACGAGGAAGGHGGDGGGV